MLKKKEFNQKKRRKRFSQWKRTLRRTRRNEPPLCRSMAIGDRQRWYGGMERRRWWILSLSLISILCFSHSDSLCQIRCGFWFALNFWRGLEIKIGSRDWRSAATAWWFGDWRRWCGGLEWRRWWILSLSLILIPSFSHSDSLSQIGCGFWFWFWFEFFASSIQIVLLLFFFFFCFDFVVRVSISNGICISSRAWIFLVGLPYLQSQ